MRTAAQFTLLLASVLVLAGCGSTSRQLAGAYLGRVADRVILLELHGMEGGMHMSGCMRSFGRAGPGLGSGTQIASNPLQGLLVGRRLILAATIGIGETYWNYAAGVNGDGIELLAPGMEKVQLRKSSRRAFDRIVSSLGGSDPKIARIVADGSVWPPPGTC